MKKVKEPDKTIEEWKELGTKIGRIMVDDLITNLRNLRNDEENVLLTYEEKVALLNSLKNKEAIKIYEDWKNLHVYFLSEQKRFEVYNQQAQTSFWRLQHSFTELKHAESEIKNLQYQPKIMTQKQYNDLKESGAILKYYQSNGIAIIDPAITTNYIDSNGYYSPPAPYWKEHYVAEEFLSKWSEFIEINYDLLISRLRECFATEKSIELMAKFLNMPGLDLLFTSTLDEDIKNMVISFNDLIKWTLDNITRYGLFDDERPVDELKAELTILLQPIDLESLKPTKEAIRKAKASITSLESLNQLNNRLPTILKGEF